jgi:hypothetical protein
MAVFLIGTTAAPSAAATTTPYSATFPQERTVQQTCPPGVPAGSFCFTGSDHSGLGTSTPPGSTATEDFAGFVDFSSTGTCPDGTTGFHDHNAVSIGTRSGNLFLTTEGLDCPSLGQDNGTWRVVGGTGIFEGASGSGTVHTQATGGTGTPSDPIRSFSAYSGTITLR